MLGFEIKCALMMLNAECSTNNNQIKRTNGIFERDCQQSASQIRMHIIFHSSFGIRELVVVGGSSSITLQISRIGLDVGVSALNGLVFVAIKFQDFVNLLLAANERWREKRVDLPQNSVILRRNDKKNWTKFTDAQCIDVYAHIYVHIKYTRATILLSVDIGHVKRFCDRKLWIALNFAKVEWFWAKFFCGQQHSILNVLFVRVQ